MRLLLLPPLLLPLVALAYEYEMRELPYSDAPTDRPTAVALSVLTEEGIIQGYPDGTFRADVAINRAEFTKIAMGMHTQGQQVSGSAQCFPDVHMAAWYAPFVCRAKELGIIEGNRRVDVPASQWLFEPARNVNYVEALKILFGVFALSVDEPGVGQPWYEPYLARAELGRLALPEISSPGHTMTRGDMVRLFVRFLAKSEGELDALLAAQEGTVSSTSALSSQMSSVPQSSSVSSASGSAMSSSEQPVQYDQNSDTTIQADFILLGQLSSVLARVSVFSEAQPFEVTDFVIRLRDPASSVDSLFVYDEQRRYLGRASLSATSDWEYRLSVSNGTVVIPRQQEYDFYVRALLKPIDAGGLSGQVVQVIRMGVEGTGVWNDKDQSQNSDDDFPMFQTARSLVTTASNPGSGEDIFIAGKHIRLGSVRFSGLMSPYDSAAALAITQLAFQIDRSSNVILQNVYLNADGISDQVACAGPGDRQSCVRTFDEEFCMQEGIVTCADIPEEYGSLEDMPRIMTLYGDISVSGSADAYIRLRLSKAGSVTSAGSVRWTDGSETFHWIPGGEPLVSLTLFR